MKEPPSLSSPSHLCSLPCLHVNLCTRGGAFCMVLSLLLISFAFVAIDSRNENYASWFSLDSPLLNPRVRESGGGLLLSKSYSIKQGEKNSTKENFVERQRIEDSREFMINSSHGSSISLPPVAAPNTAPMPVSSLSLSLSLYISLIVHCP